MRVTNNRGVDVVLEMIGGDVYQKSLHVLAPGGRLVSIGGAFGAIPDTPPALTEGRVATRFSITTYLKAKPEDFKKLDEILKLVQDKKFQVVVGKTFPLAEARAAQHHLEGRRLESLISKRQLDTEQTLRVMGTLALGLQTLHAQGVVHRDLRPEHVVIVPGIGSVISACA